jgi:hypothetical protein
VSTLAHIFNPTDVESVVSLTYVLAGGGIVQRQHTVGPYRRVSIDPAVEDALLREARFGIIAHASAPVVISETTWWPGGSAADWYEGASAGAVPAPGRRWAIAAGELYGTGNSESEIAIMNVSAFAGSARVTLVFDDGTSVTRDFALPAVSHTLIDVAQAFPEAAWKAFGATIESVNSDEAAAIVVEHISYSSPEGVPRTGGMRSAATRLDD